MINSFLQKLYLKNNLTRDESFQLFQTLLEKEVPEALISAALIALKLKGESAEEILGAIDALLLQAKKIELNSFNLIDSCGTGGDASNTFNISTTAALLASACGVNMAKHGNRSVS